MIDTSFDKARNLIVTNTGHSADGRRLATLLNRNNDYVVCDLSLVDELNANGNIMYYLSPFSILVFKLIERMELCNKTKKPLLVYSFPEIPDSQTAAPPAFHLFEFLYLCSFLHPFGFVNINVTDAEKTSSTTVSRFFPSVDYIPDQMFMVDLQEAVEKTYESFYNDRFISILNLFNSVGFYLSIGSGVPKEYVKLSAGSSSIPILPHEFIKVLYERFAGADEGTILDEMKSMVFVRAHSPAEAFAKNSRG